MKTALVTGSSSGFGYSVVKELLDRDFTVIATLRNAEERKEKIFSKLLKEYSDQLIVKSLDVTLEEDRQGIAAFVEEHFEGSLDVLINNAGYGVFGALEDLSENEWRNQLETNFFAVVLLTQKLLPSIRKSKGRVVSVSSMLGFTSLPYGGAYSASKFALEAAMESLYLEVKNLGVRVTLVEPGGHKTKFATNSVWPDLGKKPDSPFEKSSQIYKQKLDHIIRDKGADPQNVVDAIVKASTRLNPPLRVRVGMDSQASYLSRKLSQRLAIKIMHLYSKWMLK